MAYMTNGEKKTHNVFFEMANGVWARVVYSPETGRLRVFSGGNIAAEIPAGLLKGTYDLEGNGSDEIKIKSADGKQGIIHYAGLNTVVKNMPISAKNALRGNDKVLEDLVKAAEPIVMS